MPTLAQVSFASGEISPSLACRVDLSRYATALRRCYNFFVRPTGGVSNRPGLQYVATIPGAVAGILAPFEFAEDEAYLLLFRAGFVQPYAAGIAAGAPVATPYTVGNLDLLRYTQSADVMTVVEANYPQYELRRTGATTFTFAAISDFEGGPFLDENTSATTLTASAATGTGITITASAGVFNANHVGALLKLTEQTLSAIAPWEPQKLIVAAGGNPNGQFRRSDGKVYECTTNEVAGANGTFTGSSRPIHDEGTQSDGDGSAIPTVATRSGVAWQYLHSGFGIVRITAYTSPTVVTADVVDRIPASCVSANTTTNWALGAWSTDQGYPACVAYYQDRLVFAASLEQPQTEWASKSGDYHNFSVSSPIVADDAITQTLNARQINPIRELVPLDQLIALTATAAWASPKRGEAWTPETIGFDPQSYDGAAALRAILTGDTALFVGRFGTRIRDLRYQFEVDKFRGNELTVLARHLFSASRTIVDAAYAEEPDGVLWIVRSDGVLCSLTYLREQDVIGWATHETEGFFERVCVVPEDGRDVAYFIVRRTIDGSTVRYIERFASREIEDVRDGVFVDSSLSFDGRNTGTVSLRLEGATWARGDTLSCIASAGAFSVSTPPDQIRLAVTVTDDDGVETEYRVRCAVVSVSSTTVATVTALSDVPASLREVETEDWGLAFDTFSGLGHLEGAEVAITADGSAEDRQTVTGGAVTLQEPAVVVHIGLPYLSEIETLDINVAGRETIRDRAKRVPALSVIVQDTVGLQAGADADNLEDLAQRDDEDYDEPTTPLTGVARFRIANTWDANGRVLVRQPHPLPATILAVLPDIDIGETQ